MLELLNQLDGFSTETTIKVIAATNRPDTLDPALLRSGRLDRKIELPHPTEDARARIMEIHSRKMNVDKESACTAHDAWPRLPSVHPFIHSSVRPSIHPPGRFLHARSPPPPPPPSHALLPGVNFEELARSTEDFNGAMLKAVCVEAGMLALRRDATMIKHEDFVEGIAQVQMKKKSSLQYYA